MRNRFAIAALFALALATMAEAGPPGHWTPVSKGRVESGDEAGLARTPDGILHVVWQRRGATTSALWQTRVSPNGVSLGLGPAASHLSEPGSPALTLAPGGVLNAFTFARTADGTAADLLLFTASASGDWTPAAQPPAHVLGTIAPASR